MSTNKENKEALNEAIAEVLLEMKGFTAESEEYAKMVSQLETLYKIKATLPSNRVSPDAVLATFANLAGLGFIMKFEQTHALTTKALNFVIRPRA